MALFQEGDRGAFEDIFERHHGKIVNFAFRMVRDQGKAEEAAQEIFMRVARAAPRWQPTAKFTTWLYTIARRTTLNFIRDHDDGFDTVSLSAGDDPDVDEAPIQLAGPDDWNPETIAWSGELSGRFRDALDSLPEGLRAAFVLGVGEGLSYEETASVLGITVQAVKTRIFRARERLLNSLSDDVCSVKLPTSVRVSKR